MPSFPNRKRLFHTSPEWVDAGAVFFVTVCCARRHENVLARSEVFSLVSSSLEYHTQSGNAWTYLALAMPDHLHALISFPEDGRMDQFVRNWKRFLAKNADIPWQDGFFDHRLRSSESFEEKAHYIRMNPVRAGLVEAPEKWKFVWSPALPDPAR